MREVQDPLWRYLVRRTDRDTAADVLADALTVIWRRLDDLPREPADRYPGAGPDSHSGARLAWCYAVARNCLANAHRATRRRHALVARILLLDPPATSGGGAADRAEPDSAPGAEAVNDALARLSPEDRELLRLWAWEELPPRQLAVVLGITPNAASIRLHRARSRLREILLTGRGPGRTAPATRPDRPARQDPAGAGHTSGEGGQPR